MIKFILQKRLGKILAVKLSVILLLNIMLPTVSFALTSGPSQPEFQAFEPVGTTEMVDLFTGDFTYNIPLFELPGPNGGYPFNLAYHGGIGMDQEASWVGLGWSLNPGAINRNMRGLPDEFDGDLIKNKTAIKPNITAGVTGGKGFELFGGDVNKSIGNLEVSLSVYHNNYRGVGYSIGSSMDFINRIAGSNMTSALGVNFKLDTQEGVGIGASLSLDGKDGQLGINSYFNSRHGIQSLSINGNINTKVRIKHFAPNKFFNTNGGVPISILSPGFSPRISLPMRNSHLNLTFKGGTSWWGTFPNLNLSGFYSKQKLKNYDQWVSSPAFGYLNFQHAGSDALLDFNREKDGMVKKETPNLGIPSLTYDIYSATGQGMSAMYRPFRSDIGIVYDQEKKSNSLGLSAGLDVAGALAHLGANASLSHSQSTSGQWVENNNLSSVFQFQDFESGNEFEPWYFKVHGEPTLSETDQLSAIGGEEAVRVKLEEPKSDGKASSTLENTLYGSEGWSENATSNSLLSDRAVRKQVMTPFTNQQLLKANNQEILGAFKVNYYDDEQPELSNEPDAELDRSNAELAHHIAGFTSLTPQGLEYTYGLPAYNRIKKDVSFSTDKRPNSPRVDVEVDGDSPKFDYADTEGYLSNTETPDYAHSYLLTSIKGPDYIDVTGDGITVDDLGYWVKFTYKQITDEEDLYKWRTPFSQANFDEGLKTTMQDDKGTYIYGEKEVWYLAKVETKSHIALFETSNREDSRGVLSEFQNENDLGKQLHRLDEIKLYTRASFQADGTPIKKVSFDYDENYPLCKGVDNNSSNKGKLTLKKVWFEYGASTRGSLNPYIFDYNEDQVAENPDYNMYALDRWGGFKPLNNESDYLENYEFPYVEQDPKNKSNLDNYAGVWSLKEITLPSGGKIKVDYEMDDYAYVQHKKAMQMMPIAGDNSDDTEKILNDDDLKIKFKLESPLPLGLTTEEKEEEVLKYLDQDRKQLYFKLKIKLRSPSEGIQEFISGYADIDFDADLGLESDGSEGSDYTHGYFHVMKADGEDGKEGRHPFSLRAWQHLRSNQPELSSLIGKLKETDQVVEQAKVIKGLLSIIPSVRQMFTGFNDYAANRDWGRAIELDKSWVRLNSPDGIKYGGGHRVRQITLLDQWTNEGESEGVYGQIYEYTTEEYGKVISSGVAAYEPLLGGDENPMRFAKKYTESIPLRSDNNLYFEYPANENYFPGPQVGYSKITVKSIATAKLAGEEVNHTLFSDGKDIFPSGEGLSFGTTGKAIHEFYTAKEFPVVTKETEKEDKDYKLWIPIPLMGTITTNNLTSSQGYSIILNDMHGKLKKVSNYAQKSDGTFEEEPLSWVAYHYRTDKQSYEGRNILVLNNLVKDNGDKTVSAIEGNEGGGIITKSMSQENEFFVDMRQYKDQAWEGGANLNVDIVIVPLLFITIPVPVASVWPNASSSTKVLRMATTNKIIHKSGILKSVEAYNDGSRVVTEHLKWDALTGDPVLTSVNNNFDDKIYNYSIPAYTKYDKMGAAYQNIGLTVTGTLSNSTKADHFIPSFQNEVDELLVAGDEFIIYEEGNGVVTGKGIYTGEKGGVRLLYSSDGLSAGTNYKFLLYRSGRRNLLTAQAGSITALNDPSMQGSTVNHTEEIEIPK